MVSPNRPAGMRPLSRWLVVMFTLGFIVVAAGLVFWMTTVATIPPPTNGPISDTLKTDEQIKLTQLRVDIVRNSLGIIAGVGALGALILAVRRQYHKESVDHETQRNQDRTHAHQEKVGEDARHDAAERRITEIQIKAAEQLGNDKAPVRLAGLYALERLAHDNPRHRQVVINILCAYLRMPHPLFSPLYARKVTVGDDAVRVSGTQIPASPEAVEEMEVRSTAQRILISHARMFIQRPDGSDVLSDDYWSDVVWNLSGASLFNFSPRLCVIDSADFSRADFYGVTSFFRGELHGKVDFTRASFDGKADFTAATFQQLPLFGDNSFKLAPDFGGCYVLHYLAGERVGVPKGYKLIKDPEGTSRLMLVNEDHPAKAYPNIVRTTR